MVIDYLQLFEYSLWNNTGRDYLAALVAFIATLFILRIFKRIVLHKLKKLASKSKTRLDDLIIKVIDDVSWPFYVLIALYFSLHFINMAGSVQKVLGYAVLVIISYYVVMVAQDIIDYFVQKLIDKRQREDKMTAAPVIYLMGSMIKVSLWILAGIFIISNLGFDVTSLVAGLGIGGIAIALALQNILGDMLSSFSIYFDKPFQVGDFIIVGEHLGTVKNIGIKSTRIQTLHGEELVISNRELTTARIQNFKKMQKRRISFNLGVTYQTPVRKLKKIPSMVKEIIDKAELADLDRVHFKQFGDFSLNYEIVYYVKTGDYGRYMDTQQEINLALKERFEKEGIEFAYPTQKVFLGR